MSAQNKRKGSKRGTKYGMDRDDLQQYKEELEKDAPEKGFEDEFIEATEVASNDESNEPKTTSTKKHKVLKYVVAAISATAMIVGGIATGLVMGSAIAHRKEDKSND